VEKMDTEFTISIVSVIIGVIIAFVLTWFQNFWDQRGLRKKYSRVFSFELQQLKHELDSAIRRYDDNSSKIENLPDDMDKDDFIDSFPEFGLEYPDEALRYHYFKSKYSFLNTNFEKISMFKEDTIKSIIKINSLMEEYDILSRGHEKVFLANNLRIIQKEIRNALDQLKNE
jgi:hypothetical protein